MQSQCGTEGIGYGGQNEQMLNGDREWGWQFRNSNDLHGFLQMLAIKYGKIKSAKSINRTEAAACSLQPGEGSAQQHV